MKLSNQNIFDHIYKSLKQQGRQSIKDDGTCLYRAPNGDKCALGHMIKDEEYIPRMEEKDIFILIEENLLPKRLIKYKKILAEMQNTHDIYGNINNMLESFKRIALDFNLKVPEEA